MVPTNVDPKTWSKKTKVLSCLAALQTIKNTTLERWLPPKNVDKRRSELLVSYHEAPPRLKPKPHLLIKHEPKRHRQTAPHLLCFSDLANLCKKQCQKHDIWQLLIKLCDKTQVSYFKRYNDMETCNVQTCNVHELWRVMTKPLSRRTPPWAVTCIVGMIWHVLWLPRHCKCNASAVEFKTVA